MVDKKKKGKNSGKAEGTPPTGLLYHPDYLKHDSGKNHPESADRLAYLIDYLEKKQLLSKLESIQPYSAAVEWLETVHDPSYIRNVAEVCKNGGGMLDPDTHVCPESYQVALLAVGGVMAATDVVMKKKVKNAFCAVRPPGHHAERAKAMGFCIFNNISVAVRYAQNKFGLKKILVVDWDVHHGNGTQNIFLDDPSVFYFSIHQFPFYPGTGSEGETGEGEGEGFTFNMPMFAGSGDLEYVEAFENIFYPLAAKYSPEFIFVSAGFDAHQDDPLASINLTEAGYEKMTEVIAKLASECCEGRVVSVLEGGYDLRSLSVSAEKHLRVLMDANGRS